MATKQTAKRQIGMALSLEEIRRIEERTGQKSPFQLYPKQIEAITRTEHIIGVGGAKAGGKTRGGIIWMISGNKHTYQCNARRFGTECNCGCPDNDESGKPIMVNRSYIYHPKFLGCVLRENVVDLRDWVREARVIYDKIGGEFKEGDKEFVFPSGAKIFCGHYQEDDAFTKYAGLNITRFLIEEATHIPNVKYRIQMLRSCCRSVYPEMKAQMMLTFNPGGVSHGEILDLFVEPKDEKGEVIPPGTTITDEYDANEIYARLGVAKPKDVGDKIVSTRVFVFSSIKDNPAAIANGDYIAALMGLPEEEREAYLFGNWGVLAGTYFRAFRPDGPLKGEPPEANHVVPYNLALNRLRPWYWATAAMDWGYGHECAFGVAFHDQERDQLWITDEFVTSHTEPDVVGEEVAKRLKPILKRYADLGQEPAINMGLSHDAYGLRQDDRSVAELLARGMGRILGPNMVHLPDLMVDRLKDEMEAQGQSAGTNAADEIFSRIRQQQRMGITIRRMRDNRVVGWQLVQAMMRWKSTLPPIKDIYDPNLASKVAYEKGLEAYNSYLALFQQKREILPKLQIVGPPTNCPKCNDDRQLVAVNDWEVHCGGCNQIYHIGKLRQIQGMALGCPRLIAAIPKAIRDPKNPDDVIKKHVEGASDLWDMLRYVVATFTGQSRPEPFAAKRQRVIEAARQQNPQIDTNSLVQINRSLEAARDAEKRAKNTPIQVIRSGRKARAIAKGLIPQGN